MRLNGWNYIPDGYGMGLDPSAAPLWLRLWLRIPFLDRFAYPIMVSRGFAWLTPDEHPAMQRQEPPPGWRVESARHLWLQRGTSDRPARGRRRRRA